MRDEINYVTDASQELAGFSFYCHERKYHIMLELESNSVSSSIGTKLHHFYDRFDFFKARICVCAYTL